MKKIIAPIIAAIIIILALFIYHSFTKDTTTPKDIEYGNTGKSYYEIIDDYVYVDNIDWKVGEKTLTINSMLSGDKLIESYNLPDIGIDGYLMFIVDLESKELQTIDFTIDIDHNLIPSIEQTIRNPKYMSSVMEGIMDNYSIKQLF